MLALNHRVTKLHGLIHVLYASEECLTITASFSVAMKSYIAPAREVCYGSLAAMPPKLRNGASGYDMVMLSFMSSIKMADYPSVFSQPSSSSSTLYQSTVIHSSLSATTLLLSNSIANAFIHLASLSLSNQQSFGISHIKRLFTNQHILHNVCRTTSRKHYFHLGFLVLPSRHPGTIHHRLRDCLACRL